jgi:hypothetical protein
MWKLGLRPRYSFSGIFVSKFRYFVFAVHGLIMYNTDAAPGFWVYFSLPMPMPIPMPIPMPMPMPMHTPKASMPYPMPTSSELT